MAMAQEIVITTSGNLGEVEIGGPLMNVVPRSGGNTFSGFVFGTGASGAMASDNTKELVQSGILRAPNELIKVWDYDGGVGGPIKKDRLWFFVNARSRGDQTYVTGMYYNKNAGDPTQVDLRGGPEQSSHARHELEERQRSHDLAGVAEEQGQRLLGRTEDVHQQLRRRSARRQPDDVAGSVRNPADHQAPAGAPGHVDRDGHQQAAASTPPTAMSASTTARSATTTTAISSPSWNRPGAFRICSTARRSGRIARPTRRAGGRRRRT